jgi:hypothetical protein
VKIIAILMNVFAKSKTALEGEKMNPAVQQLLINFLLKELAANPQLAGNLLKELLDLLKVDPTLAADIVVLFDQLLPIILGGVK